MATWEEVQQNPTLYPRALLAGEGERIKWHDNAPHSSQIFCVSAFGVLRRLSVRDKVIRNLLGLPESPTGDDSKWTIELEAIDRKLLSEQGGQASNIDALLQNGQSFVCVESKFWKDADAGFGVCSQPTSQCSGFYGPGSDLKTQTNAWCRLEVWDGERSPRTYWTLGRGFFRESVYIKQATGETCPFSGPSYQLMRNFLFAAALAQKQGSKSFGVVAIAPASKTRALEGQIESFRTNILQPEFSTFIRLQTYERLIELLQQSGDGEAIGLATFLAERIGALIP